MSVSLADTITTIWTSLLNKPITTSIISILILVLAATGMLFAVPPRFMQQAAPDFNGTQWLNSAPLSLDKLKGKVIMVEFWTYGCYNCVNVEPYIKKWHGRYKDKGFEVVAVHSPEFSHERKLANVRVYVERKGIKYPVVIDNNFAIWRRYSNRYWPAMYLIDKQGQLRYRTIGEGRYRQTEEMIQTLLSE